MRLGVAVPLVTSLGLNNVKLEGSGWTLIGRRACVVDGASSNSRA